MSTEKIQDAFQKLHDAINEAIERSKPVPKYDKGSLASGTVGKSACGNGFNLPAPIKCSILPSKPVSLNATEVIEAIKDGRVYYKGVQVKSIEHLKELAKQKTN